LGCTSEDSEKGIDMRDETAGVNAGVEKRSRFVLGAVVTDGRGDTQTSRSSRSGRTMKPKPIIGIADATKSVRRACGVGDGTGSTTLPAGATDASEVRLPMGVGADEDCVKSIAVVDLFLRMHL
jgi:hypothetical protein